MKIGILTFHSSKNPGSVLQAYCVFKLITESFPDSKVEIINLVPWNREISEWNFISKKPPFVKPNSIQKYRSTRGFIKNHTNLSKRVYYTNIKEQIKYINKQNYDYVVAGSDTVWVHSDKFNYQLPTIYFLPEQIKAKKMSIAASVDPLVNEEPYLKQKSELKAIFDSYSLLTVRDQTTQTLIQKIGVQIAHRISDPTFLFDFESALGIKTNKAFKKEKRKVMVWISDAKIEALTKKTINNLLNEPIFVLKNIRLCGSDNYIIQDLNSYSDIDLIITDRFHRSIFGLKLSSALVINVEREDKNPIAQSKGRDLFTSIGMPECLIRYEDRNQELYTEKLRYLIQEYSKDEFSKREELLQNYINENKKKWNNLMLQLQKEKI